MTNEARGSDKWRDRHPIAFFILSPWIGAAMGVLLVSPLILMVAVIFGGALLGDELGLWHFDSGLGAEAGGGRWEDR